MERGGSPSEGRSSRPVLGPLGLKIRSSSMLVTTLG